MMDRGLLAKTERAIDQDEVRQGQIVVNYSRTK